MDSGQLKEKHVELVSIFLEGILLNLSGRTEKKLKNRNQREYPIKIITLGVGKFLKKLELANPNEFYRNYNEDGNLIELTFLPHT